MLFSNELRKTRFQLGLCDAALYILAFRLAYWTRSVVHVSPREFYFGRAEMALILGFCIAASICSGLWMGVYARIHFAPASVLIRDSLRQAAFGAVGLVLFEYMLRLDVSRVFLALFVIYSLILSVVFRLQAGRLFAIVHRQFGDFRHLLIAGRGPRALDLANQLEQESDPLTRLLGFVDLREDAAFTTLQLGQLYNVHPASELRSILRNTPIDEILFAVEVEEYSRLKRLLEICDEEGVCTRVVADIFPQVNSELRLEHLGCTPLLTFTAAPDDGIRLLVKRISDVAVAATSLVVLSPLLLAVAAAIKLTSPGPVIFRQYRCGLNGRRFMFYKFRSMVLDAEQRKAEVIHLSRRATATKVPNDPRLTSIGGFLRKFSIDELPQLFNVVKGDMSLVGPRPAIPSEVAQYAHWQRRRLRMRPGLTCLWAVNGRDAVDFETWMRMDMQYIDNWSLGLDWKIMFKTIPAIVSGRGAS